MSQCTGLAEAACVEASGCRAIDTSNCIVEFRRSVEELGFVGAMINPDPGADRQTPGMNKEYWFPLYEESVRLQAPLIVHPSISRDPRLDGLPSSYQYNNITEETLATLLLENSDVFDRYPELKIVICHCGGALERNLNERGLPSGERGGGSRTLRHAIRSEESHFASEMAQDLRALGTLPDLSSASLQMICGLVVTTMLNAASDILDLPKGQPKQEQEMVENFVRQLRLIFLGAKHWR